MKPDYSDIIDHPHWEPKKHSRMSIYNRAAQFAPFAALSGFDDEIHEAGRLTEREVVLDEYETGEIDRRLRSLAPGDYISVTYFRPDDRKDGGDYPVVTGMVGKINSVEHTVEIVLEKGYNRDVADTEMGAADKTQAGRSRAKLPRITIPMTSIVEIAKR